MGKRKIIVGSRESKLAVIQTNLIIDEIKKSHSDIEIELVTMKTTGDKILNVTLDKIGGKGLFVKELDAALMEGRIDLAVHSLKDMPMETPEDIPIVGLSKREDPRDVLILPKGCSELDLSKPIGTSSFRRSLMVKDVIKGAETDWIRGNLQTRLKKLDDGMFSGIILAAAGIKRLGLEERISRYFDTSEILPAAGQGVLAIQGRRGVDYSFLECVNSSSAFYTSIAERAFVRYLDGGCSSPVAAYGKVDGENIILKGLYYDESSGKYTISEESGNIVDAQDVGLSLAKRMKIGG
ncbi:MAG: hydroxymethylbilane synthase [Clostridium sp.]|uniref:hydroxymethylbilane synthase n=1 Tax=Clostridium sp. TaxID=1506 RepID=UPI002FCAEDC9